MAAAERNEYDSGKQTASKQNRKGNSDFATCLFAYLIDKTFLHDIQKNYLCSVVNIQHRSFVCKHRSSFELHNLDVNFKCQRFG